MWYQLIISGVSGDLAEALEEDLYGLGASSLTIETANEEEEIFEPEPDAMPLWSTCGIKALFTEEMLCHIAKKQIKDDYPQCSMAVETLEDKAWEREWLKDFKPKCFGTRLWICPTHLSPLEPDAVNIMLDPGLAFGTGTHETTALCLSFLDGYLLEDKMVLDMGTGSGILAIAAIKLGAKSVVATDIDPQAIFATKQNAKNNQIDEEKLDVHLVAEKPLQSFDLILANILSGTLISLKETLCNALNAKGVLVLSGILNTQKEEVIAAFQQTLTLIETKQKGDWVMLVFKKER